MITATNAVLQFTSNTNRRIQITVPRARANVNEAEARAAMQSMIDGNGILTDFGRPSAIHSMDLVTVNRTAMWDANA